MSGNATMSGKKYDGQRRHFLALGYNFELCGSKLRISQFLNLTLVLWMLADCLFRINLALLTTGMLLFSSAFIILTEVLAPKIALAKFKQHFGADGPEILSEDFIRHSSGYYFPRVDAVGGQINKPDAPEGGSIG